MLTRRSFAAGAMAGAGGLCLGGPRAFAGACSPQAGAVWGDLPKEFWPARPAYKILEIHLYGGLSPWETFYYRPLEDGSGWRGFHADLTGEATAPKWLEAGICRYFPRNPDGTVAPIGTYPFDLTDRDHPIHLGPATAPLWADDIMSRMRCFVTAHDLLPHEAAVPYVATGLRLGRPNFAGLGAAIQHRRNEIDASGTRKSPACYVCIPTNVFAVDSLESYAAIGLHPGSSKPITLKIGNEASFLARLDRDGITPPANDLLHAYRQAYRDVLMPAGQPAKLLRSKGFAEYDSALGFLFNASALRNMLSDDLFKDVQDPLCVNVPQPSPYTGEKAPPTQSNVPRMSLRLAASLLSNPTEPADYVCVIDAGMTGTTTGGYDTHTNGHIAATFANLYNTLASLRDLIDLKLVDLDTTLVILNTEFGRTPSRNFDGRDHWPQGYVVAMIGGPISRVYQDEASKKSRVIGRIEDSTAQPAENQPYLTITDLRAGALLAAGICPFEAELFGIGDLSTHVAGSVLHDVAVAGLKREVFGVLS